MKICQNCLNPIIGCGSKFCSLSCAAIYNNNRLGTGKINEKKEFIYQMKKLYL